MFSLRGRLGVKAAGFALAFATVLAGCASTGPMDITVAGGQASPADKRQGAATLESIDVVGEGDRVMVSATGPVKYTVFRLSDPQRLIVDLPGISTADVPNAIKVNNDFLNDITVESYGGEERIGRIIIGLKDGIEHEVKSGENSLLVMFNKPAPAPSEEAAALDANPPAAEAALPATALPVEVQAEAPKATEAEPKAEARHATAITGVELSKSPKGASFRIKADGAIGSYNSFELDTPSRVIVDLWGVSNSSGKEFMKVGNRFVRAVRIGSHSDKVRLVFDSPGKVLPVYNITKTDSSLVVAFGGEAAVAKEKAALVQTALVDKPKDDMLSKELAGNAAKAAPAAAQAVQAVAETEPAPSVDAITVPEKAQAEVKEKKPLVEVEGVDYKGIGGNGRLTVVSTGKTAYTVKESDDGKTVVLDISGARIKEELIRTLDASKLNTPVQSISSYQQSVEPFDVRVLVRLGDKASYEVKEDNGTLTIDFAGPAAQAAVKESAIAAMPDGYSGKRIDLDMVDVNITDILRLLAEVSNLNIIASDDVKGTISLRLKNVPWDHAFDLILRSKDLDKTRDGNIIRVAPAAKLRQEKEAALAALKAHEKLETLDIEYIAVNYAKASELGPQIKGVLTDRGSVSSDERTNTLIVKDIALGVEAAVELVRKLDTSIPQVLIEARIVEAESSFARDLGIQWGLDYASNTGEDSGIHYGAFGSSSSLGQSQVDPVTQSAILAGGGVYPVDKLSRPSIPGVSNYAVNLPATGTAGTLGALGFILGKAGGNPLILDLRISAGEQDGRLKTISRPRITTMDNKEAKIQQGESIPFSTTSATGTSTTFIDANLSLTVTPHITPDGSVLMKIKASRNSIGTFRTASGEPSINKKESSTEVLVKDSETTVIGGIVISDKSETERGIPYLMHIPVIGWFFKTKSISDTQKELLIFITPTIIKEKEKVVG